MKLKDASSSSSSSRSPTKEIPKRSPTKVAVKAVTTVKLPVWKRRKQRALLFQQLCDLTCPTTAANPASDAFTPPTANKGNKGNKSRGSGSGSHINSGSGSNSGMNNNSNSKSSSPSKRKRGSTIRTNGKSTADARSDAVTGSSKKTKQQHHQDPSGDSGDDGSDGSGGSASTDVNSSGSGSGSGDSNGSEDMEDGVRVATRASARLCVGVGAVGQQAVARSSARLRKQKTKEDEAVQALNFQGVD